MSEFKFACPVCGQHITCDSDSGGSQMVCPTCFRNLVVPQSTGSKSFVLTASEVQNRPTPVPGTLSASGANLHAAKKFSLATLLVGVFVCGVLAAGVTFGIKKYRQSGDQVDARNVVRSATSPTNVLSAPVEVLSPPAADATNWTLNLAEAKIPNAPVSGNVRGFGFNLDRAVIQAGRLDLRQGPKWPPDVGVSLHLYAERPEDLAGRTVVLEASRTNSPRLILRWKDSQDSAVTKDYRKGYAARVEFGPVSSNRLSGKIFIAVSDDTKSHVAGTFSAEIRRPQPK
jgi:hypothetical protein